MDIERTQLKTRDIEALVCQVNALHSQWRWYTLEYDPDETVAAQAWRDEMIKCLSAGATFSWCDFRYSLSSWPEGMVVRYQEQLYTVQAGKAIRV